MSSRLTRFRFLLATAVLACAALPSAARAADPSEPFDPHAALSHAAAAQGKHPAPAGRIVGGPTIPITSAPYQVALVGFDFQCGGVILNATTLLTAAHCTRGVVAGKIPQEHGLGVIAGSANLAIDPPGQQLKLVSQVRVHPYYDAVGPVATNGDLAVLTLSSALNLATPQVKAVPLPPAWAPVLAPAPVPADLRVTGYGLNADKGTSDDLLHEVTTTAVTDPDLCGGSPDAAIELCAISPLGSSCQGDSGGPLVTAGANPVLVGIVSNGGDCGPNTVDRYANLYAPENRAFIDGSTAPPRAPRWVADPSMTGPAGGALMTGDTITCTAGAVSDPAAQVKIDFTTDAGAVLQSSPGTTASLVIPESAAGSRISCRPYAANGGGTYVGRRFVSDAVVTARPKTITGGQCPSAMSKAKRFKLRLSVPKTARRGKKLKVTAKMSAPPVTAHVLGLVVERPRGKALVKIGRYPASTTTTVRSGNQTRGLKQTVKVSSKLRVGRTYRFRATLLVADTVDDFAEGRVCEYGTKSFKVRIRR